MPTTVNDLGINILKRMRIDAQSRTRPRPVSLPGGLGVSALVLLFSLLLSAAPPASAQIPTEFTNLKLLSQETERGELIGIMRSWATGLGVRCNHCHVGPDDLVGADFASDEKPAKQTARRMLELSRQINGPLLEALPTVEGNHQVVSCYTCHRGQPTPPKNTTRLLGAAFASGGVDAAIAEYKSLVADHGDTGRYDLSAEMLQRVARRRLEAREGARAVAWMEFAVETFPESASSLAMLGMAQMEVGQLTRAKKSFAAALEIDPDEVTALRALPQLEKGRE